MTLVEALNYLISASGLGALAYMVLHWLDTHWPWYSLMRSDLKRVFSLAAGFLLGAATGSVAYLLLIWMGATGPPGSPQEWADLLAIWGFAATAGAQGYHGRELVGHGVSEE